MARTSRTVRLGFAVKVLGDGGLPSHDTRRWSSGPHLRHSLERLTRMERRIVLPQRRAHADLVDPIAFEHFLQELPGGRDLDVMLEAKAKDLALLKLRDQLAERGLRCA